jgi:hypothetical protein
VAAQYGLVWTAIAYNVAVLIYWPRSVSLILPLVGTPLSSYLGAFAVPLVVTLGCMLIFMGATHLGVVSDWPQLSLGGLLAIVGMGMGGFCQRRRLESELAYLNTAMQID